jgi:plastocyanin
MARISFAGASGIACAWACALASVYAVAAPADAAAPAAAAAPADVARLQGEIDRLKKELAAQRQLILQLMQAEQQRYDVVLKYLQMGGAHGGEPPAQLPPLPSPAAATPIAGQPAAAATGEAAGKDKDGAAVARETATVTGKVRTASGLPVGEAYVYLDGARAGARGRTLEIRQRDKQFTPRVAVVPIGTKLVFPNQDTVIHNVFSTAPGNAFDLGSVKGGETSPPVVLLKPGVVEIFCNIHSKMRADVLVVPNAHWTRVAADGSFQLTGVPVGSRKIALWSPTLRPTSQQVDVTAKGGSVAFTSEAVSLRPHMNKRGQAYGSYDE